MGKREMKPSTLLNPLPAVMVTCGSGEEANIITIGWTGIINSEPPMTYVSVRKSRHSHKLISESGEFVINLTTEDLAFATDFCGVRSGRDLDKAKEMKLTYEPASVVSAPLINESPINLECKVTEVKELGSHDMFMAEIVKVHVDEELFEESGRIALERCGLITYCHGEYYGIKKKVLGTFGYSVMKPKTKKRKEKEAAAKRRSFHRKKKESKKK